MIALAMVTIGAATAGCGTSASPISTQASRTLTADVQSVRAAAAGHDRALADTRLAQLRADVAQLLRQGQLSNNRATAVLAAATVVQAQLASIPNPPPPTTTTTSSPPTTTGDHSNGHGDKGHTNGNGGD